MGLQLAAISKRFRLMAEQAAKLLPVQANPPRAACRWV